MKRLKQLTSALMLVVMGAFVLTSCQGLRYTDNGKPLDFLRAHRTIDKAEKLPATESVAEATPEATRTIEAAEIEGAVAHAPEQLETVPAPKMTVQPKVSNTPKAKVAESTPAAVEEMAPVAMEAAPIADADVQALDTHNIPVKDTKAPSAVALILLVILAFLLPPLAVFLVEGIGTSFWISIILTLLFVIPGIIHALIVVFRNA